MLVFVGLVDKYNDVPDLVGAIEEEDDEDDEDDEPPELIDSRAIVVAAANAKLVAEGVKKPKGKIAVQKRKVQSVTFKTSKRKIKHDKDIADTET